MTTPLTVLQAFAAIPVAAVCCDQSFGKDEARLIREQLLSRTAYQALGPYSFGLMIADLLQRVRQDSWQGLITAAAPQLSEDQQETAFALACQLIHCDREVKPAERAFLTALAGQLTLDPLRATQILEVCAILQRDCLNRDQPAMGAS